MTNTLTGPAPWAGKVQPFRAGRLEPGALTRPPGTLVQPTAELVAEVEAALVSGAATRLSDVSEFQPNISWDVYVRDWSAAAIIRAMYGPYYDDRAWYGGARRAALWAAGARWVGIYQYLTAGDDPVAQAEAFVRLVGTVKDGEVPVCDLEEGSGNQLGRWLAWRGVVMRAWPQLAERDPLGQPQLYSGLYFGGAHGLTPGWVAAYGQSEPRTPHWLWQFTDAAVIPGIPGIVDCSVAWKSIDELAALAAPLAKPGPAPGPTPSPAPVPAEEDEQMELTPGTNAVTVVTMTGGSHSYIGFAADTGLSGGGDVKLRVAAYSNGKGAWSQVVDPVVISGTKGGRVTVSFTEKDVSAVSVQRVSGTAADDTPVAWSW